MIHFKKRGSPEGYGKMEGMSPLLSEILHIRGISTREDADRYLYPNLEYMHDPFLMQDMDKAVSIIKEAVASGKKITVYGDYDVDGVCATSIMMETLTAMGANVSFRIPSRHQEGYGLNTNAIREMGRDGTQLLITVDCGVTNIEESMLARQLGMQVIVTDHHQLGTELPRADAVLNPLLGDYPFRRLCGAGVALKLTQALLGFPGVRKEIDLAALATVADVVPLSDENRIIVKFGMMKISWEMGKCRVRPGIGELIRVSGTKMPLNSGSVAFQLAPRINAGGRLEDAMQCVRLMITKDGNEAREIADHLDRENSSRKEIENEIIADAEKMIPQSVDFYKDRAIVIVGHKWNTGIVGLAAGKICEKYHFPTIVISEDEGVAVGSCRSIPGVNIFMALSGCADLFTRFGGHEMAAGLTLPVKNIPEFRERLNQEIDKVCSEKKCYIPVAEYDAEAELSDVTESFINSLSAVSPTGFGNPGPTLLIRNADVTMRKIGNEGKHLKLQIRDDESFMDGIAFSMGYLADRGIRRADMVFTPEMNEFRGQKNPQLNISCIAPSKSESRLPEESGFSRLLLQEIFTLAANSIQVDLSSQPIKGVREATIHKLLSDGSGRGILIIAHTTESGKIFSGETDKDGHSMVDVTCGAPEDMRAFNTIVICPDAANLRDAWHTVVFADKPLPGERELVEKMCPRAEMRQLSCGSWQEKVKGWTPSLDELRHVYKLLSICPVTNGSIPETAEKFSADGMELSPEKLSICLEALSQVKLIELTWQPFSTKLLPRTKCSPMDTPIMKYLLSI